jgi:tetratricopeptide (TPR) repeat protein
MQQFVFRRALLLLFVGFFLFVACASLAIAAPNASPEGKVLLEQGHYRQLYRLAQQRLATNSNDADALAWLSAVYDAEGDFDKAVDYARRATEAAPSSSESHCQLADTLGDKALKAGIMGGAYMLARQMRHELDRSLELDPQNIRCLRESMGLYEQAPVIAGGSKSKARQMLQRIQHINPAEGARAEAALLQMQKKPLTEIEAALRRAVQLNPRFYPALMDLTSVLASDSYGRYADAEHFARQAIAADPDRVAGYTYLAIACARQQHWSDLEAALEEAQRHVPEDFAPLYSASLALLDTNSDLPRAERYLRKYLTQEPEAGAPSRASSHWKLGLVLEKEGRLSDAARELRAAAPELSGNASFTKDYKRITGEA